MLHCSGITHSPPTVGSALNFLLLPESPEHFSCLFITLCYSNFQALPSTWQCSASIYQITCSAFEKSPGHHLQVGRNDAHPRRVQPTGHIHMVSVMVHCELLVAPRKCCLARNESWVWLSDGYLRACSYLRASLALEKVLLRFLKSGWQDYVHQRRCFQPLWRELYSHLLHVSLFWPTLVPWLSPPLFTSEQHLRNHCKGHEMRLFQVAKRNDSCESCGKSDWGLG